jgi:hypothetical protein
VHTGIINRLLQTILLSQFLSLDDFIKTSSQPHSAIFSPKENVISPGQFAGAFLSRVIEPEMVKVTKGRDVGHELIIAPINVF